MKRLSQPISNCVKLNLSFKLSLEIQFKIENKILLNVLPKETFPNHRPTAECIKWEVKFIAPCSGPH